MRILSHATNKQVTLSVRVGFHRVLLHSALSKHTVYSTTPIFHSLWHFTGRRHYVIAIKVIVGKASLIDELHK